MIMLDQSTYSLETGAGGNEQGSNSQDNTSHSQGNTGNENIKNKNCRQNIIGT